MSTNFYFTNAPEAYDYGYVKTIKTYSNGWRKIKILDNFRFENFQIPRYGSGMYSVETDIDNIYPPIPESDR